MQRVRIANDIPLTTLECGQIHGMADEPSCGLLESRERCLTEPSTSTLPLWVFLSILHGDSLQSVWDISIGGQLRTVEL